jgi:uncharacterized lipoprotein YddW (UPF0748 family)
VSAVVSGVRAVVTRAVLAAVVALAALMLAAVAACGEMPSPSLAYAAAPAGLEPPPPPREFRGAWVATLAHIDWPSRPGLSAQAQRAEATALLDRARSLGLNALILQVRAAGDAIYPSALEPWSEVLSGVQGRAPEPAWDPLAWWVQEAHRRGLELHAWFNPYRARHSSARSPLAAPHLALRQPALVRKVGDQLWLDPGEPAAAAQLLAVVADVLRRYDVDGVHLDDYFYPYPVAVNGVDQPFPDDEPYARYRLAGGLMPRDDWRRANVDALVQDLYRTVHAIKPWVRVGISPFGIGRPDRRPPTVSGFSQYDRLYADVERWLENGWLDYLAPQLYWPIDRVGQPFPALLDYWIGQNRARRHVWPGLYTSQIGRTDPASPLAPWRAREVLDQVLLLRTRAGPDALGGPGASGHVHFSMAALIQDRDGIATLLQAGLYAQPALVPATPWLGATPAPAPGLRRQGSRVIIEPAGAPSGVRWALWRRVGADWHFGVLPSTERSFDATGADAVAVAAVDRVGNVGSCSIIRLP